MMLQLYALYRRRQEALIAILPLPIRCRYIAIVPRVADKVDHARILLRLHLTLLIRLVRRQRHFPSPIEHTLGKLFIEGA